jgi:hypothetical protein
MLGIRFTKVKIILLLMELEKNLMFYCLLLVFSEVFIK